MRDWRRIRRCGNFAVLFLLLLGVAAAMSSPKELRYYYRVTRFPADTPDSMYIHFDFSVPYSHMVFVLGDSLYRAELLFYLYVMDTEENLLYEKEWRHHVSVARYDETLSDSTFLQFSTSTVLPVGKYKVVVESRDENVGIPHYERFSLKISRPKSKSIVLGDMVFLRGKWDLSRVDVKQIRLSPRMVLRSDFTVYAEALLLKDLPELQARLLWRERFQTVREDTLQTFREGNRLKLYRAYSIREAPLGRYVVQLELSGRGIRTVRRSAEIEIVKQVQFYSEEALDRAIEQLVYIGEGPAYDSLRHAKTFEQKKYWFNRFWQEYYPSADSLNNPAREEYYRRVRYANHHFGDGIEGWRTDRGRIYILYGPPDDIQHSMDQNFRNYEVWIYGKLQKQFVFVEDPAYGDYRLIREM